ncbi:MAG: hypothetical protein ACRDRO_08360 [Pseudonocardiaceae bacterium]
MGDNPRRKWPWIVGGTVPPLVVLGLAAGSCGSSTSTAPVAAPQAHAPAAPKPDLVGRQPAHPSGPLTTFEDGTYQVGIAAGDVPAGTYRTTGSTEGMSCYWARTKATTDTPDTVIASGYAPGPATVTIKDSDGAFVTSGCARWTRDGGA